MQRSLAIFSVMLSTLLSLVVMVCAHAEPAHPQPRARDLGIPFEGTPGPFNAITDVAGVEVGYKTLISGDGKLVIGKGPVRTGVTAILPRGRTATHGVLAGFFSGNGNGDMTGTHWIDESGVLETPILITNTNSVGVVREAAIGWLVKRNQPGDFWYPVEEAVDNALLAARTMTGPNYWVVEALPQDQLLEVLRRHRVLESGVSPDN